MVISLLSVSGLIRPIPDFAGGYKSVLWVVVFRVPGSMETIGRGPDEVAVILL
ncbi:hypothetical protein DSM101010T_00490 [Desulfovibrio subterraneus]|uniref:Uncharacterized protein n=1 Tax=Desulfovibrio subterraneus TaxID=2718620 RepID=A0A7J0BEQ2_9BACT|nr:hypothetical protein DSM101010T_00490 [Desulfovibrio subterraneus]